ncbi:MAG: cobalamin biosynthesis protein CbiX [Candidatus Thiodiazotropha sp. (ex Monitilora ramsayi)]|nr:cobalamin biosynthesis protein CbiX [Candidatus Thiodiazotropha sp. (ex Monitilora ramsayi)]
MALPTILLVDNGSRRAGSVLSLRGIAAELSSLTRLGIHPVSLQHADKIPSDALGGTPAETFTPYLQQRLEQGDREFLVLPLFFGPSRTLTSFITEQTTVLQSDFGHFNLSLASVLCPLPEGEPRLADILIDQIIAASPGHPPSRVVLVDHGSPIPEVTAVRSYLATQLRNQLEPDAELFEAVMERRNDPSYDFNGELLETVLNSAATEDANSPITLSLLFMSPGRHAGQDGDIETICEKVRQQHPGLQISISPLVGAHPTLIKILNDRLQASLVQHELS